METDLVAQNGVVHVVDDIIVKEDCRLCVLPVEANFSGILGRKVEEPLPGDGRETPRED